MQLQALLDLALALSAAASPTGRTKTRTLKPQPTRPIERCFEGTLTVSGKRFEIDCTAFTLGPQRYTNFLQNAETAKALTIAQCATACAKTANCCSANFDLGLAQQKNTSSCRLNLKPATDFVCSPDEYITSTGGITDSDDVAIFLI